MTHRVFKLKPERQELARLEKEDANEAISLLKDAEQMTRWQYSYGASISLHLAYAYALKGDFELAGQNFEALNLDNGIDWLPDPERTRYFDI